VTCLTGTVYGVTDITHILHCHFLSGGGEMEKQFHDALDKEIQKEDQPDRVRDEVEKLLNDTDYLSDLKNEGIEATVEYVITKALDQLYNTEPLPEEVEQYFEDFYEYAKGKSDVPMKKLRSRVNKLISDGVVYYGKRFDSILADVSDAGESS
jgi:hypothetical protein